jgi:hypothetical protein
MNTEKLEKFLVAGLIGVGPNSRGLTLVYANTILALARGYRLNTSDIKQFLWNFLEDQRSQLEREVSEDWWLKDVYDEDDEINRERLRYYRDRDAALNAIEGYLR